MNRYRRRSLIPLAATAILGLAACTPDEPEPSPTPETTQPTTTTPAWNNTTPSQGAGSSDDGGEPDSLEPEKADKEAREGARDAALATAEVWVKGQKMDQVEWSNALMNTLTPYAQDAYADRWWGYRIPATKIDGEAQLKAATQSTGRVVVPTDAGDLTITVTRPDPNSRWLTSSIDTP